MGAITALLLLTTPLCGAAQPSSENEVVPINGTELFVKRIGSGEPILVVHGGPVLEHGYLIHDELARVTTPTLILYGDAEPGRQIGGAALKRALLKARAVTIEDAGHFPFIENPDQFFREVRGFLDNADEKR